MKPSEKIKKALTKKPDDMVITDDMYLSSGSTLLNLAASGKPFGCFVKGHYYFFVGDSDSGKTFLVLTSFAEAAKNPNFDNYRLIYDPTENGAIMDFAAFFGKKVADRVEFVHSTVVQEFYYNVDDAIKQGKPFIYVLDSQDGLSSKEEIKKFEQHKKAFRKSADSDTEEKKVAGSYGDGKAKHHSEDLRKLMAPLAKSGSILIIINQTRDSFSMFEESNYSGGRALKFYATLQLWSSPIGNITKRVMGKERQLGIRCRIRVKKNRITGRNRQVRIPIYHSCGVDETGSMVDYLVDEGIWKSESDNITENTKIKVTGIGPNFIMKRSELIEKIENEDLVDDLKALVVSTWNDIEAACKVSRKRRYE